MSSVTTDPVLTFIHTRFPIDCNWTNGNCYYFAIILSARFPSGKILYDPIMGHFLFRYKGKVYDYNGEHEDNADYLEWAHYTSYDPLDYARVVRDVIQ